MMPHTHLPLPGQRSHWKQVIVLAGVAATFAISAANALAQGHKGVRQVSHSREQTRAYIDDYSTSLGGYGDFDNPVRGGNRYSNVGTKFETKSLRPLIQEFSKSMTQLTYALNDQLQSSQISGLRQAYSDSLRLSGAAVNLDKRSERQGAEAYLVDDLRQLDADWRELAYRLESQRGLSADVRSLVTDINDADLRIRELIGIQPQLDRRQMYLKSAALAADVENLQEDIAAELGNSRNAKTYRQSLGRIRQTVLSMAATVRDDQQDSSLIVDEFKQFEALWTPLVAKLRAEDDRYIERGVRRVAASAVEMQQLLLLPRSAADQSQMTYLAKGLKKDIDEFFERTPLILVIQLPKANQALSSAGQLYNACAQFVDTVNRSQDQSEILDSFRQIEQAERLFIDVYRDVDSDKAIAVLNRINQSMNSLRSSLQITRDDFDNRSAENLAASIQNLTEQIELTSKRWLTDDRQVFANDCLDDVADLSDRAAKLHDDILSGRSPTELATEMSDLYDQWRRVYKYLTKCQTDDRMALGRLASSLTPAMVDLRTMLIQ